MEGPHIDPGHAGPASRFDTEIAVFPDQAALGPNVQPAGCFKKWIGVGLVPSGVLAGNNGVKAVEQAKSLKDLPADRLVAAGDDRQRQFTMGTANGGNDRINCLYVGQLVDEGFFLEFCSLVEVDLDGRLNSQRGQDVAGWPATERIETIFIKGQAVQFGHLQPGPIVGRHGVGEGAVTVKQQGLIVLQVPVSGVRHRWCYCGALSQRAPSALSATVSG